MRCSTGSNDTRGDAADSIKPSTTLRRHGHVVDRARCVHSGQRGRCPSASCNRCHPLDCLGPGPLRRQRQRMLPGFDRVITGANANVVLGRGQRVLIRGRPRMAASRPRAHRTLSICSSTIRGLVSVSRSTGFVLIGDGRRRPLVCGANSVGGNTNVSNNANEAPIAGNDIAGSLIVNKNAVPGRAFRTRRPRSKATMSTRSAAASAHVPPPTNDGQPNTVKGRRSGQCGSPASDHG